MPQNRHGQPSIEIAGRVFKTRAELEQHICALDERNVILNSEQSMEQKMSKIRALFAQLNEQ